MATRTPLYSIDYPEVLAFLEDYPRFAPSGRMVPAGKKPLSARPDDRAFAHGPGLTLNGSGDYHHETAWLFDSFCEQFPDEKFCYIQIDAHPDKDDYYRWKLDCASFVGRVMEHRQAVRVYLLGLYPECLDTEKYGTIYIPKLNYFHVNYFRVLRQFIARESPITETFFRFAERDLVEAQKSPAIAHAEAIGEVVYPRNEQTFDAMRVGWKTLADFSAEALPKRRVYLTIDLDVCKDRPVTDWRRAPDGDDDGTLTPNQGELSWQELVDLVATIGKARPIAGADICGLTHNYAHLPTDLRADSGAAVAELIQQLDDLMQNPPSIALKR